MDAELGLPVELNEGGLTVVVNHSVGVNTEAFHHPIGAGDAAIGHVPDCMVLSFRMETGEIPERIVSTLCLGNLAIGMRLARMDDVRELDAIQRWTKSLADSPGGPIRPKL